MAAEDCRSGCLVVTIASDKTWRHPDTNKRLKFDDLIAMLNEEASRLSLELGGSVRIMAKGLDLRPRLPAERAAKSKPMEVKRRRSMNVRLRQNLKGFR
jgi:hypothetical protein